MTRVVYRNQKRNVEVCNPSNWRRTLGWWGPDVKSNTLHNWSPHEANLTFVSLQSLIFLHYLPALHVNTSTSYYYSVRCAACNIAEYNYVDGGTGKCTGASYFSATQISTC